MKRMGMKSAAALVLSIIVTGCNPQPQADVHQQTLPPVGQGSAYTRLALMYKTGQGVDQNTTHALELFKKGCADKDPIACTNVAEMQKVTSAVVVAPTAPVVLSNVNLNDVKSLQLYTKSCDKGFARACSNLARMYEIGIGTTADKAKAKDLYKKSCDLKLPIACKNYDRLSK